MALELPELEVDDIVVGDDGHVGTVSLIDGDNVTVAWSGNELTEENFDMLNELSRKKLSQYTRRAATDLGDAQYEKGRLSAARYTGSMSGDERRRDVDKRRVAFKKVINRSVGLDRATSKLAKEDELPEDETIDEKEKLGKPQKAGAKVKTKKAEADAEMAAGNKRMADALDRYDRAHGIIYRHIESKVPEDDETIDELSKKKLGSYLFNAIGDFSSDQEQAATDGDKYDFEAMKLDKKRATKRANGISKAIETLTKEDDLPEDDETIDELSRKTLGSYVKKSSQNLGDLKIQRGFDAGRRNGLQFLIAKRGASDVNSYSRYLDRGSKNRKAGIDRAADKLAKEDEMAPVTDEELDEKWGEENVTKPSKRGMWNGWSLGDLRKAREGAIGTRRKEIDFVIRAKTGWGKVSEEEIDDLLDMLPEDEIMDELDEEQIDELSKGTLDNYLYKARPDGAKHARKYFKGTRRGSKAEAEADRKMTNRDIGTRRAVGRLAKMGEDELPEDNETIDELSRKTLVNYVKKAKPSEDEARKKANHWLLRRGERSLGYSSDRETYKELANDEKRKVRNRTTGQDRAFTKLAKEDELPEDNETIDELSKGTLGRYINKARKNEKVHRSVGDYHADEARRSTNGTQTDHHMKVAGVRWGLEKRRDKGIKTAVNKLTKEDELTDEDLDWIVENITEEDFEQLDELSRYTLLNYAKKAHNDETEHGYESDRADLVAKNVPKHSRQMWQDKAEWHAQKHDKRSGGVNLALKKALRKEDELPEDDETIDELSKGTLGRYINKAHKDAGSDRTFSGFVRGGASARRQQADDASRYADKHAAKRDKGIKTAVKKLTKEEDEMIDETAALDSLQPGSHTPTDPKSKLEYLNGMIGMMASMQSHELEKFWGDAVALVGKEADKVPAGAAGNQASINAKPSNALGGGAVGQEGAHAMVDIHDPLASGAGAALGHGPSVGEAMKRIQREDLSAMLDGEQLSEEFKDKAATLFEAAVGSRLSIELAAMKDGYAKIVEDLETEHEEVLAEEIEKVAEQITEGVESYLDYVSERWLTENELAVESQLRNEIAADFMVGLRNLLDEHWIDVPDGPEDVLASVLEDFESLRAEYNKTLDENMRLSAFLAEKARDEMVDEATSGLSETQKAKFRSLCENVEADDADEFQRKLETIKEAHFLKGAHKKPSNILTEAFDGAEVKIHDPAMKAYSETITRNFKTI